MKRLANLRPDQLAGAAAGVAGAAVGGFAGAGGGTTTGIENTRETVPSALVVSSVTLIM